MIRILHLITSLDVGGTEIMLAKLLSAMDKGRFHNQVVSLLPPGPVAERIQEAGCAVTSLGGRHHRPLVVGFFRLLSLLRSTKPDIVQTWLYHADLLGLLVAKIAGGSKVVWNIRCSHMDLMKYSILTRLTVKACTLFSSLPDAMITNAASNLEHHMKKGYRPKRFVLIPNGFDTNAFRPDHGAGRWLRSDLGISDQSPLIGLIARFDPMKDPKTFILASAMISKEYPSARFLLCGQGMDSGNGLLRKWLSEAGVEARFLLLGYRNDVPGIMNALEIAVSSSTGEGFSNSLGEAMSCGIPCVATNVGDSAFILGDTGRLVPPRNPGALADAVLSLLSLPRVEWEALKSKTRERVVGLFSLPSIAKQYEEFYLDLTRSGSFGERCIPARMATG